MSSAGAFLAFLDDSQVPIRLDEPLALHTTFGVGGPADFFIEPRDEEELAGVVRAARGCGMPLRFLGGGANLLVRDEGVRGAVARLAGLNRREGMHVQAGFGLGRLVRETAAAGLAGLEGLAGVPGSVGGAVKMNAGGRHGEIGAAVRYVDVRGDAGEVRRIRREDVGFRYRGTGLNGDVILAAGLDLRPDPAARERHDAILEEKKAGQPLGSRSAGCVFKNPPGGPAGKLIEECGLKGERVGGARVSRRHANFIVNDGGATASDILKLIDVIRRRVPAELELEIQVW